MLRKKKVDMRIKNQKTNPQLQCFLKVIKTVGMPILDSSGRVPSGAEKGVNMQTR